jgi:hypothetical protein
MFQVDLPQNTVIERPAPQASVPAAPPVVAAPPHDATQASPKAAGPDLSGFQQTLEVQPTLAVHGWGEAHAPDRLKGGVQSVRTVFRDTLPSGWRVYTKPGVSLDLPIVITSSMTKTPWTQTVKRELRESGLHGALWWNQRILTVWAPPAAKVPVVPEQQPKLSGYQKADLGGASATQTVPMATGAAPALQATPVFTLNAGDLILTDLQKWAKQSGWTVVWQVPEDWQVPNTTTFSGDFQQAVSQVIQALAANGANVHAVFHTANNTVVISGAGGGE